MPAQQPFLYLGPLLAGLGESRGVENGPAATHSRQLPDNLDREPAVHCHEGGVGCSRQVV